MAVTASGLLVPTWRDVLGVTQLAVDLDAETHKGALFTNAITPNFSTDTAYGVAPYNANEVTSAGWAAGGILLTGTTITESPTGTLMFDANDLSASGTTLTNARCVLLYANSLAGKNGIVLVNFGADYSTSSGVFTVQWAAAGIFTWDVTP